MISAYGQSSFLDSFSYSIIQSWVTSSASSSFIIITKYKFDRITTIFYLFSIIWNKIEQFRFEIVNPGVEEV